MNRYIASRCDQVLWRVACDTLWSGYDLVGSDITTFSTSSQDTCDDSCQNCDGCNAWTLHDSTCHLKNIDMSTQIVAKGSGYVSWVNCA